MSRPTTPPNTQESCSTVSDRPKADARLASGSSCWITESRQTLASDDAVEPTRPTSAAVARPGARTAIKVDKAVAASERIETVSGLDSGKRAPRPLPTNPPTPAAAPTTPSSSSWVNPLASLYSLLITKAMNSARKPVSTRMVPFAQSVVVTDSGNARLALGPTPSTGISPAVDSTQAGMRRQSQPPAMLSRAVKINAPVEPNAQDSPAATPPAIRPNTVSRELVLTRVMSGGSTRGVIAAFSTLNDFDSTSMPSAQG